MLKPSLLAIIISFSISAAKCQTAVDNGYISTWRQSIKQVHAALHDKRFDDAEAELHHAVDIAKIQPDLHLVSLTDWELGNLYQYQSRYLAGEDMCNAEREYLQKHHAQPVDLFPIVCQLGLFSAQLGKPAIAKQALEQALGLRKHCDYADFELQITALSVLASIAGKERHDADALKYQQQLVDLEALNGFPTGEDFVIRAVALSRLYTKHHDFDHAAKVLSLGCEACKQLHKTSGICGTCESEHSAVLRQLGKGPVRTAPNRLGSDGCVRR